MQRLGTVTFHGLGNGLEVQAVNTVRAAEDYFPIVYQADGLRSLLETCALICTVVAVACLLTLTVLYVLTLLESGGGRVIQKGFWASEKVAAPGAGRRCPSEDPSPRRHARTSARLRRGPRNSPPAQAR